MQAVGITRDTISRVRAQAGTGLGLAALLSLAVAGVASAQVSAGDRACILASHKAFVSTARADAKLASACVKAAASGRLEHPSVEACIAADDRGKVAGAAAKAADKVVAACAVTPAFGVVDPTGVAAGVEATGLRTAILQELFGDDLGAVLVEADADERGAACQAALVKGVESCWKARMGAFGSCASGGLKSTIGDAAALGECREADPSGKVAAACGEGLRLTLLRACAGADLDALAPGCECRYAEHCIDAAVGNLGNAALADLGALGAADDVLPVVRVPQASAPGPWVSPQNGEYVASRIRGRETDAPLACPLGAVNVYTIQDAMADAEYNAGIFPLILQQRIRITFLGDGPVDLLGGSSTPELVQGEQAMPIYGDARDFLRLSTRRESWDLVDLKSAQVGDTLRFGFEHCLHDCDALYAATFPPFLFSGTLLVHHFRADRATLEAAVPALAAEAEATPGVRLRWAGRAVADFQLELVDGSVAQAFHALPADGTLIYEIDDGIDAVADVLTLPVLSDFVDATSEDAIVQVDVAPLPF